VFVGDVRRRAFAQFVVVVADAVGDLTLFSSNIECVVAVVVVVFVDLGSQQTLHGDGDKLRFELM
jgi:hypothetical protein